MIVRPEIEADHPAVFRVLQSAFGRDNEARLVDALRISPAFVPELSIVAVDRVPLEFGRDIAPAPDTVVGHILFSRIAIRDGSRLHDALALAPLAVIRPLQNRGIGSALVRQGLDDARRSGHRIVIVVGHPEYYPRFGFLRASTFGIHVPFDSPDPAIMALGLRPDAMVQVRGSVEYPIEFFQF